MIPIKFHAVYLPNHGEFNVTVKFGKKRLFEKMTVAKFLRFARQQDKQLVFDGVTIKIDNDENGESMNLVRNYFKMVADSYVALKYRNN